MEKRLRSALRSSVEEFLSAAASIIATKPGKSAIKTLIWSTGPSSSLPSSLPPALHLAVSRSLDSFTESLHSHDDGAAAPRRPSPSPPSKRTRRSSRHTRSTAPSDNLDSLKNLQAYAYIAHICISHPKKLFSPLDLLPSAQSLHDSLTLFDNDPALLSMVAGLCEDWWKENLPRREVLMSQSLAYFLARSLTQSKKADVHRVHTLREAFALFDYVDESIEDFRILLVRCVVTPIYLKTEEGRRFLVFILGLNDRLAKEALALIKSQIPFGRKSMLEAYADVIFRAWKGSEGSLREEIEDEFLPGLIEGAIHARTESLASSVRRVLGGFVDQRATDGVEKLLFRLVEPVLFRSLQVANSNVRKNALHLLLDMFPLEDPGVTKEVKDTMLEKQFFLLERLVVDECPVVRAVAVEGSCRILHLFWEVIPSSTITKILTKIVDSMSHDVCSQVRLSTVNGIIYLLDNPQSHEILKVLLPSLGCMFLDPVLSVRVAVADLLLAVRDIRTFQFNKVVGLQDLLSSLANDHVHVAQKITRLLIPSYFPSKVTPKEACSRCIALIKRAPIAGARFCEFALSEGSSSKSLMELLSLTVSLALSPKGLNSDQIDGLFIASDNISRKLSSEPSFNATLSELFSSEKLKCLLTAAVSPHARTAVLNIASNFSPHNLAGFRDHFMAVTTNCVGLSENVEMQTLVHAAHKLIVSCGWIDDLFGTLTNTLQAIASNFLIQFGLEMPQQALSSLKKKNNKLQMKSSARLNSANRKGPDVSKTEEDFAVAAAAAWQMKVLLASRDTRNALLKSPHLEMAFSALRIISQASIEQCALLKVLDTSPFMAYTAFAIYMSLQNAGSSLEQTTLDHTLNHVLNYAEELVSRNVPGKSGNGPSKSMREEDTRQQHILKDKVVRAGRSNSVEGGELKTDLPRFRRTQNEIKMATSVLKFMVDAATMGLVQNLIRCLKFASAFARHVVSAIETQLHEKSSSEDEDLKETTAYLRSSLTYAAKLLHLVLKSSSESSSLPSDAFSLANDLLDLITSIEAHLGPSYASHIVSAVKPWLPILILGLGSKQLIKVTQEGSRSEVDELNGCSIPSWLAILGKVELSEVIQDEQGSQGRPQKEAWVFKNLLEMMILLLKKGDPKILDAVGGVFFSGLEFGLKTADFGLVLGVVHFVCVKLLCKESSAWKELKLIPNSLREVYLWIEGHLRSSSLSEDGRNMLESAMTLLRSYCMSSE